MQYVVLAILMLLLGILVTTFKPADPMFIPIVRMRSPEGFFVTYVRDRVQGSKACQSEIRTYVEPLQAACPACAIESSACATELVGMEKALAENRPLPVYVVRTEGLRMSVVGPPQQVKVWCESVAAQIVRNGLPTAACVYPSGPA
jgi:hypothetical protein